MELRKGLTFFCLFLSFFFTLFSRLILSTAEAESCLKYIHFLVLLEHYRVNPSIVPLPVSPNTPKGYLKAVSA